MKGATVRRVFPPHPADVAHGEHAHVRLREQARHPVEAGSVQG
jgi:hypothetical protein